jgi:hypothetical protein
MVIAPYHESRHTETPSIGQGLRYLGPSFLGQVCCPVRVLDRVGVRELIRCQELAWRLVSGRLSCLCPTTEDNGVQYPGMTW